MGNLQSALLITGAVVVGGAIGAITFAIILGFVVQKFNEKKNKTGDKKINMAIWDDEFNQQNKNEGKARNNY